MANKLTAYRLPEDLLAEIDRISIETKQDKTAVVIQLLKAGLSATSSNTAIIQRITPLTREEMEDRLKALEAQFMSHLEALETRLGE